MLLKLVLAGALVIVVLAFAVAAVANVGFGGLSDPVEREDGIAPNGLTHVVVVPTRAVVLPTETGDTPADSTLPVTTTTLDTDG